MNESNNLTSSLEEKNLQAIVYFLLGAKAVRGIGLGGGESRQACENGKCDSLSGVGFEAGKGWEGTQSPL